MLPPPAMHEGLTAAADWVLILPVALSILGAALLLMLRALRVPHAWVALAVVAAVIACDVELFRRTLESGPLAMTMGNWLPPFGISFAADVMGAGFALVAAAVTFIVLLYMQIAEPGDDGQDAFYPLVLMLLAGVSGAFLTGDLFNLYVWFEVMLIASFGLLVFRGRTIELDATVKYGFINFLATTFFLLGLGLLYGLLGTLNMADIILRAPKADPVALASIAGVLLLAFGIKAAAFPVNAWLPAAYHAPPAAVSALLAALPTKVGVYALLRVLVALLPEARDVLQPAIVTVAIATLLIAPLGAIAETNLRRALGFVVIGGIGAVIAGLALPSVAGIEGAVIYVVHAMASIAALYLVAGLVERVTGQFDTRLMGGVYAANSLISIMFLVLILAVSGVPPFLGFWPKLLLLQAALAGLQGAWDSPESITGLGIALALLLNALLTLIAGTRLWSHIFWRPGIEGQLTEDANPALRKLHRREVIYGLLPAAVLTAAIVVAGLWPNLLFAAGKVAATDLLDPARYIAAVGLGGAP